jgi:hypothetical protein
MFIERFSVLEFVMCAGVWDCLQLVGKFCVPEWATIECKPIDSKPLNCRPRLKRDRPSY